MAWPHNCKRAMLVGYCMAETISGGRWTACASLRTNKRVATLLPADDGVDEVCTSVLQIGRVGRRAAYVFNVLCAYIEYMHTFCRLSYATVDKRRGDSDGDGDDDGDSDEKWKGEIEMRVQK